MLLEIDDLEREKIVYSDMVFKNIFHLFIIL